MQFRTLGKTGLKVSEIGFGAWAIGGGWGKSEDEQSKRALLAGIDAGINFIDTAEGYGNGQSEELIAATLKEVKSEVYVATKIPPAPGPWPPSPYCKHEERYGRDYLRTNLEARLKALDVETIDLLQLHTWTAAWNEDPEPLLTLQKMREEGKIRFIGVSTPEQDQGCVIDLMRDGLVDTIQIIFNLFHQEPAAQILPVAKQTNTGVIVRVAMDEGALSGKYKTDHQFAEGDFRSNYFAGDRLQRTIDRVAAVREDLETAKLEGTYSMADLAIRFALDATAISTVITGIRNIDQATMNAAVSALPPLPVALREKLHRHNWLRGVWYSGK